MFGKKDKVDAKRTGDVDQGKTTNQQAQAFIKAAKEFEVSRIRAIEKSRTMAWRVAGGASFIALVQAAALIAITPLKTVEPFVIRVDNNTGMTDVVSTMKTVDTTYDEVMNKFWLSQYIKFREGYEWETIQSTFDATILLSSPKVQNEFKVIYDRPDAPHKVLKNIFKVTTKVNSISFIGDVAQIRYQKTITPITSGGDKPVVTRWLATVSFAYENRPRTEEQRQINPLGFQVTSYRNDPESNQ